MHGPEARGQGNFTLSCSRLVQHVHIFSWGEGIRPSLLDGQVWGPFGFVFYKILLCRAVTVCWLALQVNGNKRRAEAVAHLGGNLMDSWVMMSWMKEASFARFSSFGPGHTSWVTLWRARIGWWTRPWFYLLRQVRTKSYVCKIV